MWEKLTYGSGFSPKASPILNKTGLRRQWRGRDVAPCRFGLGSLENAHQPTVFWRCHFSTAASTCERAFVTFRSLSDLAGNVGAKQHDALILA